MFKTKHAVLTVLVFGFSIIAMIVLKAVLFGIHASADVVLKPMVFPDTDRVIELGPEIYPDVGEVIDLLEDYDLVVFETRDGNQWVFEGIEDWFVGDKIAVVFNDSGTRADRSDDWIVSARYFA